MYIDIKFSITKMKKKKRKQKISLFAHALFHILALLAIFPISIKLHL